MRRPWPLAALVGALLGVAFVAVFGGRLVTPTGIDASAWNLVSPGLDENVTDPGLGRGTHVVDGALVIRQHVFFRADMLSPKDPSPVARLELGVAPGSGVARVMLRGDGAGNPAFLRVTADQYLPPTEHATWQKRDDRGPWIVDVSGGQATLKTAHGAVALGKVGAGTFELTAESGEARFSSIRAVATDGHTLVDEDYTTRRAGPLAWAVGAGVGVVVGLLLGAIATSATSPAEGMLAAAFFAMPPVLVGLVPSATWLVLVERLYLARTPAWELSRLALAVSLLPMVAAAALRSGILAPADARGETKAERAWIAAAVVASVLATRAATGWDWLGIVPGLAFALLPVRVARLGRLDAGRAFACDAPALLAVAALGWHEGLWLAVFWRFLVLIASTRALLGRAPRAAADLLSVLLLAAPASCELAVRGTYLADGWDARRLSGELAPTVGWRDPVPYWAGRCGDASAPRAHAILYAGGSSTGGAYQFHGEPEAFFPARVHALLCASLPADTRLASANFGDGGRDSFTISRTIDTLLDRAGNADLVVLYTGVNDLVGSNNTKTRKQREADEAARGAAMQGLMGLAMRSRLLTGASLWVRPLQEPDGQPVPDVPLPDAEENIRRIAAAATARHARVLLVTEYVTAGIAAQLAPYEAMERRLANELDGVDFVDLRAALAGVPESGLLVDRNHLSRDGGQRVAEVLAPAIADALGLAPTAEAP